jgi:hypothetical protein
MRTYPSSQDRCSRLVDSSLFPLERPCHTLLMPHTETARYDRHTIELYCQHCPFYVGRLHSLDCSDLAAMFAAVATDDLPLLETVLDACQHISPNDLARHYVRSPTPSTPSHSFLQLLRILLCLSCLIVPTEFRQHSDPGFPVICVHGSDSQRIVNEC